MKSQANDYSPTIPEVIFPDTNIKNSIFHIKFITITIFSHKKIWSI